MRYLYIVVGVTATVLRPIFCLPQYVPLQFPALDNTTIAATNLTGVPASFPFVIEGCGAYTGNLVDVLIKAIAALTPALNDVGLGLDSHHGFRALFKDGAISTYVRGILRSIASAQPLKGLKPDPSVPSAPRFACVTRSTVSQYKFLELDPWEICSRPDAGQAFYLGGSSYIFLCSSFWWGRIAPHKNTCPSVRENQFLGGGEALSMYLTYLVIHEMVHFYLGKASLGAFTDPPEVYPINDCVALDPLDSVHNPQNYQFYVAMAEQGCTKVPDPDRPPFLSNQSKSSLPAFLLTDAVNTQPSLAAAVEKLPTVTTIPVLESLHNDPDDNLGLQSYES
ncbi:hypothetical protein HO173_006736 [Letharia columbiana]|uniref:Lysine-specific metallo-endopeptidase domain-containing protein n=1 Tax=Letharia columbiana TaxID=112416 RepID=A0A8H6FUS0_9LECA|nr:uncharacterized protein HO173_006736 [Letharia columbiana]KAF6235109.1 hypothetical protein HO173_006736 [Letharia columbiana]